VNGQLHAAATLLLGLNAVAKRKCRFAAPAGDPPPVVQLA